MKSITSSAENSVAPTKKIISGLSRTRNRIILRTSRAAGRFASRGLMGEKKQIVFYYDGEIKPEDTQVDSDRKLAVPKKEQVIEKHGQKWRVTFVQNEIGGNREIPVYKAYLARVSSRQLSAKKTLASSASDSKRHDEPFSCD